MSSKRRQRRNSCSGKRRFSSAEEAEGIRRYLQFKEHYPMGVYRCPFCGGYHRAMRQKSSRF